MELGFPWGDVTFIEGVVAGSSLSAGSRIWLDEFAIDPLPADQNPGLLRTFFNKAWAATRGQQPPYDDYSGGSNNTNQLHVGANNNTKSLLRFDLTGIPDNAVIDEAIVELYHTGRTNGNALTLGAHGVLADWVDAEANRTQRQVGYELERHRHGQRQRLRRIRRRYPPGSPAQAMPGLTWM